MSRRERSALFVLLALFLLLATVYNVISIPFEAPDEIGHFYYVVYLLQHRQLPVVPASEPPPNYEHEGIQPPLYYASAALFVRALAVPLGLDLTDINAPLDINPHSVCARPGARYNVTYLAHDPHQEQFPYRGRVRVLHIVRLWSSLLGMATVAGVFAATRLAFPDLPLVAWLAASLTAFTPEFLFTAGAVSNDNLVTVLTTWGVYLVLRIYRDGLRWSHTLPLALLAGLSALSKLSGALLLPFALLAVPLAIVGRSQSSFRETWRNFFSRETWLNSFVGRKPYQSQIICNLSRVVRHSVLIVGVFLVVAGWWFVRNWALYGDLTGTRPMLATLSTRQEVSVGTLIRELPGLFCSWWGVFGCTAPPQGFYLIYLALVLGGMVGLIVGRRRSGLGWGRVGVLLVWLTLLMIAYIRWNWSIHAPKGRLLYPAMVSVMGFLGRGWACWLAQRRWLTLAWLVLLVLVAGAVPLLVMAPPATPPPIYSTTADIHPHYPLDGRFGSQIALIGYDLGGTSFEPGEWLELTLYWHVLARPADHYTLAIQLVSAVPGEMDTLINFNTWTGGGNYPTGLWHPGDIIADRYRMRLPGDVSRAQGWHLQVALFDLASGHRLPFALEGNPAGDMATLTLLRVGASNPEECAPPQAHYLASPTRFGEAVVLDGVRMMVEGEALSVTLWWRSEASLAKNYVTFVHLYNSEGQLIATADGPPLSGGFPTSLWQPGDRVCDERTVLLSQDGRGGAGGQSREASLQVGIGWYDPDTGGRLVATTNGVRLADDELLIPVFP